MTGSMGWRVACFVSKDLCKEPAITDLTVASAMGLP